MLPQMYFYSVNSIVLIICLHPLHHSSAAADSLSFYLQTRMQAINPSKSARYTGVVNAVKTISAREGMSRAWYGMPAVVAGAGPAHALYFACYEKLKWMISERKQGTVSSSSEYYQHQFIYIILLYQLYQLYHMSLLRQGSTRKD